MAEKLVLTKSDEATSAIFGAFDSNVRMIERAFDVRISNKSGGADMGDAITVTGERGAVELAARTLEYLKRMSGEGETLSEQSVEYVIGLIRENPRLSVETISVSGPSREISKISSGTYSNSITFSSSKNTSGEYLYTLASCWIGTVRSS